LGRRNKPRHVRFTIFSFSVMDKDKQVITDLQEKEGQYKIIYIERYKTFPWWGDTKYFVIAEEKESPFKSK
jgi:hypothetical protein